MSVSDCLRRVVFRLPHNTEWICSSLRRLQALECRSFYGFIQPKL